MSLLNITADGLPALLVALYSHVLRAGSRGILKANLLDAVAPTSVVDDDQDMARKTLNSWIDLGLFISNDDTITVNTYPAGARSATVFDLLGFMRKNALRAALADPANTDFWGTSGASDLTRALSWLMMQDVYRFDFTQAETLERQQIKDPDKLLFRNLTRLTGIKFWAPFLGFSREPFAALDPTVALRDVLPDIIDPGQTMGIEAFLDRVSAAIPVLDSGRWQTEVRGFMDTLPPYTRTAGAVSPALSRALLSLRASRELHLVRRSDTQSFMMLTGASGVRADHSYNAVTRVKGARS